MLFHLIYSSIAINPLEPDALSALLEVSKRNNAKNGITGMLLYIELNISNIVQGQFIQFLEGGEKEVMSLFSKIKKDPRHHSVMVLNTGFEDDALFADWRMGFRTSEHRFNQVHGFKLLDEINFSVRKFTKSPAALLKLFYEINSASQSK